MSAANRKEQLSPGTERAHFDVRVLGSCTTSLNVWQGWEAAFFAQSQQKSQNLIILASDFLERTHRRFTANSSSKPRQIFDVRKGHLAGDRFSNDPRSRFGSLWMDRRHLKAAIIEGEEKAMTSPSPICLGAGQKYSCGNADLIVRIELQEGRNGTSLTASREQVAPVPNIQRPEGGGHGGLP